MVTAIHRLVEACRAGSHESCLLRLPSGWAVMGSSQFLRGYCVLLPDPVVPHLNAMDTRHREQFLSDMAKLGDAVLAVTQAIRINYAMFGNVEPALHAHVIPRFHDEAEGMRTAHPWLYEWNAAPQFNVALHGALLTAIRQHLVASTA